MRKRASSRDPIDVAPAELRTNSLRSGWVTQALLDKTPKARIAARLRHKDSHATHNVLQTLGVEARLIRALMP
jgi:hypothetical protein